MDTWNSKVCIVCCGTVNESSYESMVFVVDLGLEGCTNGGEEMVDLGLEGCRNGGDEMVFLKMHPTLRMDWNFFNQPAICIIDTKVYVFESYHGREKFQTKTEGKAVYTFQLSEGVSNLKLEKSMMCKEDESMKDTKFWPRATITPTGKILVFSSMIEVYSDSACDFELYDPCTRMWSKLPNLPVSAAQGPDFARISVKSFTFLNGNTFLLRTSVGVFTLNLEGIPTTWWWRGGFCGSECIPSHSGETFLVIENMICVIPFRAFDIGFHCIPNGKDAPIITKREDLFTIDYIFPELLHFTGHYSCLSGGVTLVDHEDEKKFSLCFLHTGINDETMNAEMMLQVYGTRLPPCRNQFPLCFTTNVLKNRMKMERESIVLPGTSKLKSFKIVVAEEFGSLNLWSFSLVCCLKKCA